MSNYDINAGRSRSASRDFDLRNIIEPPIGGGVRVDRDLPAVGCIQQVQDVYEARSGDENIEAALLIR